MAEGDAPGHKPSLPTIITSFGSNDPFRTPAASSAGSAHSPERERQPSVPVVAVSDSSGRLLVPSSPEAPEPRPPSRSTDGGQPPSPAPSVTSSEGSRTPFIGQRTSHHPLAANESPTRNRRALGRHTRNTPSVATMGSVFTDDGGDHPVAPIAIDFDDSKPGAGRERQASVGGMSVPETVGERDETEEDVELPKPATSPPSPRRRTLWQRLARRTPKASDDEPAPEPLNDEEGEDAMVAARRAAREAAALPDPPESELFPFKFSPRKLNSLIDPKSIDVLTEMGGIDGLLDGLRIDPKRGLTEEGGEEGKEQEWEQRCKIYGANRIPDKPTKGLLMLMWIALHDKILILLLIAAVVSFALGLYTTFRAPTKTYRDAQGVEHTEPKVDWVEGVAIGVAVAIVTIVGSLNDWQKERQFRALNAQKDERSVKVLRSGLESLISVHDLRVGDVALLEPGEIVPVDGVLLDGHAVRCDESSATGESDAVRKATYDEIRQDDNRKADCFLLSGSKVIEGYGRYVVIAVGRYSFYGKIMMSLQGETEATPLQLKLNRLAELIAKLGSLAGGLLLVVLFIKFLVQLHTVPNRSSADKAQAFIQVLVIAVTVVVVAVPEGLPLAVTLALAFATKRMTKMNLLVRVLSSCETMANATVVCTDKTGTLTTNRMTVVAGSVGVHLKFADHITENQARVNANDDIEGIEDEPPAAARDPSVISEKIEPRQGRLDFSMDMDEVSRTLEEPLRRLLNDSIAINSTAFEGTDEHGQIGFVGSKTETALLEFGKRQGWGDYRPVREGAEIVQMVPFSSERKAMGVVVAMPEGGYRFLVKGASEVLTKKTTRYVYVANPAGDTRPLDPSILSDDAVRTAPFDHETHGNISRTIIFYANQSLRTIALCYRDFPTWPPERAQLSDAGEVEYSYLSDDLTLLAVVGIEDPLRPGVKEAVATCAGAGVAVKMVTGDNIITAKSIATQCGIYSPGGVIMEGPVFRKLSEHDMLEAVPRLQVLARSSPEDKKLLVEHLKARGEVVGVTGDGSNDSMAIKIANVGFSMGVSGTEVAKEASDIIVMDDNFASIVSAIMWGRCVNDSVKKFLQFQISVNITAVIVTFITSVASSTESSVLTAVQLLWVNLIMDTFAALALATDPATPESLKRKPDPKTAGLISVDMWKMIIGQSIFQLIAVFVLNFAGSAILGLDNTVPDQDELKTLIFNTFVFCQIFNQLNARVLDRKLNVLSGFWRNYYFLAIMTIMVAGQILIVFVGGAAFQVTRMNGRDWAISIIVGAVSLPLAVIIKFIPTKPIADFCYRHRLLQDPTRLPQISPAAEEELEYNEAIEKVRYSLATYSQIRGGRLRSSSFVLRSRDSLMKKKDIHPGALMTMVPTLVMSSIGAGWQPVRGSLSDPATSEPSPAAKQLWRSRFEIHPDTDAADPVMRLGDSHAFHLPRSRSASNATSVASSSRGGHSRHSSLGPPPSPASPKIGNTLSVPSSPIR